MAQLVRYLSHPEVAIDPTTPVPDWSLNDVGRLRVARLAGSGALSGTKHVISSAETKAIETAAPLAQALGCRLVVREAMHENDRSATGYLPPDEFQRVADRFFAQPRESIRGWEPALAAQARIVREVRASLLEGLEGNVLFVGHGGVGTLLFCALCDVPISRAFDQGAGGGFYFEFRTPFEKPLTGWQPMERLIGPACDPPG